MSDIFYHCSPSGISRKKIGKLCGTYKKLCSIARHYKSTVKMAFFICFRSILAVFATILKMSVLGIDIVSFKYLLVVWALIYGQKDCVQCNRHGTRKYCVFNCSGAVFSGKNRNIIYPILKCNIKYFMFCYVHVFFY